jgi:flagellar hook-associated protein 1 FlgK
VSDLLSSLHMATRSLQAQQVGLGTSGQNIANVNTPGYTRRVVDLEGVPSDQKFSAGRGVEVSGIRAQRDRMIERRLEQELMASSREASIADTLGVVQSALGRSGESLDARLAEFFDSFARLADSPTSAVARQEVVLQGSQLAAAFRDMAGRFAQAQRDTDRRVTGAVDEVNDLTERIAALNDSISRASNAGGGLHQQDEQAELVRQLAELTDITVLQRGDGGLDISMAGGRALVVGENSYALDSAPSGVGGRVEITLGGVDVTDEITGGEIGGLLYVRDVNIPDYLQRLDTLAFEVADEVNTLHAAGYDLNGNTGQDFFAFSAAPVGVTGAAAALGVDAAVSADASLIAAAEVNLPGDNGQARALARLRDARVLDGGCATLNDGWSQLVYRVGRDVQSAQDERAVRAEIVSQVETLRDQVSGISLDEEAMQLMKFQRAYEANARFFRVIDQTLETLMTTVLR